VVVFFFGWVCSSYFLFYLYFFWVAAPPPPPGALGRALPFTFRIEPSVFYCYNINFLMLSAYGAVRVTAAIRHFNAVSTTSRSATKSQESRAAMANARHSLLVWQNKPLIWAMV